MSGAPTAGQHQVLARKWRPRKFAELVGQEHVVRALSNALDTGRLHHAYLFTGTRGVGKTTLARILAKALNCATGLTSTPCGACQPCLEIDGGRFVDLVEVDAATNTRVEEMRELLDTAQYLPVSGRFKVYIIDEVHMLSRSAFNSMLKTLEEPPEHVKFILATTDPQKVPVTVLSRCLQFNLKQMAPQPLAAHLAEVLRRENVPCDAPALALIARAARGSMRDGLSLLDQAIAFGGGRVEAEAVGAMLGTISQDHLFDLLEALHAGDGKRLLALADAMTERSLSLDNALQDLASLLHRIAVVQTVPDALDREVPDADRVEALARNLPADDIQLYYQIALLGRRDLGLAPDEQSGFSMTLLRMLAFRLDDGKTLDDRGAGQSGGGVARQSAASRKVEPRPDDRRAQPPERPAAAAARAAATALPTPVPGPVVEKHAEQAAPIPPAGDVGTRALPGHDDAWVELVRSLDGAGVAFELAKNCEFGGRSGNVLTLRLPERQKQLLPFREKLKAALGVRCGPGVQLEIAVASEGTGRSVAALDDVVLRERLAEAAESIESDPFVREMKAQFGARVIESSICPEDR